MEKIAVVGIDQLQWQLIAKTLNLHSFELITFDSVGTAMKAGEALQNCRSILFRYNCRKNAEGVEFLTYLTDMCSEVPAFAISDSFGHTGLAAVLKYRYPKVFFYDSRQSQIAVEALSKITIGAGHYSKA